MNTPKSNKNSLRFVTPSIRNKQLLVVPNPSNVITYCPGNRVPLFSESFLLIGFKKIMVISIPQKRKRTLRFLGINSSKNVFNNTAFVFADLIELPQQSAMADELSTNPFVALFPTIQEAQQFRNEIEQHRDIIFGPRHSDSSSAEMLMTPSSSDSARKMLSLENVDDTRPKVNSVIENIFLITIDKELSNSSNRPTRCVYLSDVHQLLGDRSWLDLEYVEQAAFERLMLDDPANFMIVTRGNYDDESAYMEAGEKCKMKYLYMCYYRSIKQKEVLKDFPNDKGIKECQNVIITNSRMVLCHPEIYEGQVTSNQFVDLFLELSDSSQHHDTFIEFMELVFKDVEVANLTGEDDVTLLETCQPILDNLVEKFKHCSLGDPKLFQYFSIVHFFSRVPCLAKVILTHSTPRSRTLGNSFELTLIGCILRISCLPRSELGPFEFFDQPSQRTQQEHSITESNLWNPLSNLVQELYEFFNRLLRVSPDVRHQLLNWLAACFQSNSGRGKLWTHVQSLLSTDVSDSFMLNLGAILLRLCKPFCQPNSAKMLRIDPTYCMAEASTNEEIKLRGVYLRDLLQETCLINAPEDEVLVSASTSYNFTTICFFLSHRCLSLGFNALFDKMYEEARVQGGENSEAVQNIKLSMERGMSQFLSMKAAMLEPNNLDMMLAFQISTATWLTHLATTGVNANYELLTFPLSDKVPSCLACIPEFIVDSIAEFIIFLRRFSAKNLELCGVELNHLMTLILVFMGNADRIRNPHLRAKLAEMLEALMPHQDDGRTSSIVGFYHREKLFTVHPHVKELVGTLLNVFVSIEMTGQSVAFEQKFNYRRPMYVVMDYIWKIEIHRQSFKKLAEEAEQSMESTQAPLFLRFINLLINDAIFLLDEALSYMARLKEQQHLRETGGLQTLPIDQRQQNETNFQHMGMLARFHNVMGNSTIHVLELITQEIRSIFTHPSIVDRIAAMLNYFLLHLVGPKKKQLKVRDLAEYEFKPHDLVRDICLIYLHLGNSQDFCVAVSRDGRSYSLDLFTQAEQVLSRIGQSALITQIQQLATTVNDLAVKQKAEDEVLGEAPEEFLDPIMGTIMADPVILPSSKSIDNGYGNTEYRVKATDSTVVDKLAHIMQFSLSFLCRFVILNH
uniref:Ubiquitin conjugation factor E4 A n=1 Tax=Strigamia maritima TaxID=126957 RepID=T1JL90_STRMM